MTAGAETPTAEAWLYAALTADPAIEAWGVHADVAPADAPHPLVSFQYAGGVDIAGNGGRRIGVNLVYIVKAVSDSPTFEPLRPIAAAIDAALHRASGVVVNEGEVWGCLREAPFRMVDPDGFRHLGGEYRLFLTGTD